MLFWDVMCDDENELKSWVETEQNRWTKVLWWMLFWDVMCDDENELKSWVEIEQNRWTKVLW